MKLAVGKLHDIYMVLAAIINEGRCTSQIGRYRISRLYTAFEPEGKVAEVARNDIIKELGVPIPDDPTGLMRVPEEKMPEYNERWAKVRATEVELDPPKLPLADLGTDGSITAAEFLVLGELISE